MNIKSEQYYTKKLNELKGKTGFRQHSDADCILCTFLRQLGYNDIVDEYVKISRYYPIINREVEINSNYFEKEYERIWEGVEIK